MNSSDAVKSGVQCTRADVWLRSYQLKGAAQFLRERVRGLVAIS
jgi:hypothetical protein